MMIAYGKYIMMLGERKDTDSPDFQYVVMDYAKELRNEIIDALATSFEVVEVSVYRNEHTHFMFVYDVGVSKRDLNALKLKNPDRARTLTAMIENFEILESHSHYRKVCDL